MAQKVRRDPSCGAERAASGVLLQCSIRGGASRPIKKYGNRRLYDTRRGRYITLEELAEFLGQYMTWALEMYLQAKQGAQTMAPFNPFLSAGNFSRRFGMPVRPPEATPPPPPNCRPCGASSTS
jgi:hypothetical protein